MRARGNKSKRRTLVFAITLILIILLLLIPIPTGVARDGGTRTYTALTYKVVVWRHFVPTDITLTDYELYENTRIFLFPDNFKSTDELWELECALSGAQNKE